MTYKDVLALFIQSLGVLATFILLSAAKEYETADHSTSNLNHR